MRVTQGVAISHYACIVNVIQMALHHKVNQNVCRWKDQRYRVGDVAAGSKSSKCVFL